MNWTADKVIALVVIIGCFVLMAIGVDSYTKQVLGIAVTWLLGSTYTTLGGVKGIRERLKKK